MGSRLRRLAKSALGLAAVGKGARWKEDLMSLKHLARVLGFSENQLAAGLSPGKSGHFTPCVVVTVEKRSHTLTLDQVPGSLQAAVADWNQFQASFPRSADGKSFDETLFRKMFFESRVADPVIAERFADALKAAGIVPPALAQAEAESRAGSPPASA
jgi:hypothetical protein